MSMIAGFFNQIFHWRFGRFFIVGCINAMNGIMFSMLFGLYFNTRSAFICGYITSLIISYFLNTYFTFQAKPALSTFLVFPLSYVPNFLIQFGIVELILRTVKIDKNIIFILAVMIAFPINYILMGRVFRRG